MHSRFLELQLQVSEIIIRLRLRKGNLYFRYQKYLVHFDVDHADNPCKNAYILNAYQKY